MAENPHIWHTWASNLHRWGLQDGTAVLLEIAGPLTMLLAQVVYIGQPLFGKLVSADSMTALVTMLEEPAQTKAFVKILREAS